MTTHSETMEQYLNFVRTRFLIYVLVFVSLDYELGRVSDLGGVDHQSRTGLIFIIKKQLNCTFVFIRQIFDDFIAKQKMS